MGQRSLPCSDAMISPKRHAAEGVKSLIRDVLSGLVPAEKDKEAIQIRRGGRLFGRDDLNNYSIFQEVPLPLKEKLVEVAVRDELFNRAMGSMLGMAVGDSLGHPFEFLPVQDRPLGPHFDLKSFEFIGASNTFQLKRGQWTDDAAMGLCMADSLILKRGFDGGDMRVRFWCWWNRGYNNAFRKELGGGCVLMLASGHVRCADGTEGPNNLGGCSSLQYLVLRALGPGSLSLC